MRFNPSDTPWGPAEYADPIGNGIIFVGTASHGGYWLNNQRQAELASEFPGFVGHEARPWYEEDCDAMLVCVVFSYLFQNTPNYFADDLADSVAQAIHRMGRMLPKNTGWRYVSSVLADRVPVTAS